MKKITVTVGIPAYNEEANISNALTSIISQKADSFILEKIIVFCDGCTDRTEEKVVALAKKYPLITVISEQVRQGKVRLLNRLYRMNKSDICVTFDADIILGSEMTIEEMVQEFTKNPRTVMVVSHQIPIRPATFAGKVIYAGYQFWDTARLTVKNYDHIQNHYGAATALRGTVASQVAIPNGITDERGFVYLKAKEKGNFVYSKRSFIFYRPVGTVRDFMKLGDRSFMKNQHILARHFGREIYSLYHLPLRYKLRGIVLTFLTSPVYTALALALNIYSRLFTNHDELYNSGMWEVSRSTKHAIPLDDRNQYHLLKNPE